MLQYGRLETINGRLILKGSCAVQHYPSGMISSFLKEGAKGHIGLALETDNMRCQLVLSDTAYDE